MFFKKKQQPARQDALETLTPQERRAVGGAPRGSSNPSRGDGGH